MCPEYDVTAVCREGQGDEPGSRAVIKCPFQVMITNSPGTGRGWMHLAQFPYFLCQYYLHMA